MKQMFRVKLNDAKDCFLRVPYKSCKEDEFAKMVYGTSSTAYFSTLPELTIDSDNLNATVSLNSCYARQLGISQDELVTVNFLKCLPTIQSVYCSHKSEDLDALGLSSSSLEEKILHQIKVVWPEQSFPVWLGKNFNFIINIESLSPPCSVGIMCPGTELDLRPRFDTPSVKPMEFHQNNNLDSKTSAEPEDFRSCEIPPSLMLDENINAAIHEIQWPMSWGETPCNAWCSVALPDNSTTVEVLLVVYSNPHKQFHHNPSRRTVLLSKNVMVALGLHDNGYHVNVIFHKPHMEELNPVLSRTSKKAPSSSQPAFSGAMVELIEEAEASIELALHLTSASQKFHPSDVLHLSHNIILFGCRGSGRTAISKEICQRFADVPHFVHIETISCRSLVGKRADVCGRILSAALDKCFHCEPSILFLDDLDCLAPSVSPMEEATAEGIHNSRISEVVSELLWQVIGSTANDSQKVMVLATAISPQQLSNSLICARGSRFFTTVLHIPFLETDIREKMLLSLLGCSEEISKTSMRIIHDVALRTTGFVASDLADLVDKAIFDACGRKARERMEMKLANLASEKQIEGDKSDDMDAELGANGVMRKDLESALSRTFPISLHGTKFVNWNEEDRMKTAGELWEDIGGLRDAKKMLEEAVLWPIKHPKLFKSLPLKPRRGMLLYGPPGTGKTQLVSSLGGHCGLRLINVKGPELLSKYIGASEEAVRNIFKKACSAQPCVLFFDEFESLAPRRGHDSTGVTDRVVNQLLTQLDGVEDDMRDGMFVIAATTRPDLIDPALLRPGRLDMPVLCPVPDEEDRMSILSKLSSKLSLEPEVELPHLAKLTDGFTGADLQAVLYSSQLLALKSVQSQNYKDERKVPKVEWKHILQALDSTRPSLSKEDFKKYERIYSTQDSSSGNIKAGQKVSLA